MRIPKMATEALMAYGFFAALVGFVVLVNWLFD